MASAEGDELVPGHAFRFHCLGEIVGDGVLPHDEVLDVRDLVENLCVLFQLVAILQNHYLTSRMVCYILTRIRTISRVYTNR